MDTAFRSCGCGPFPGTINEADPPGTGIGFISSTREQRTCDAGPESCQIEVYVPLNDISCPIMPTPTPTPTPPPTCGPADAGWCEFLWQEYCECAAMVGGYWNHSTCQCEVYTPILIDTTGNGFSLTNAVNGVDFDLDADGFTERLSWTSAGTDDAWLALDRNGNNSIDDGTELFGNYTTQPEPPYGEMRNGFLALAVFDNSANGGNGDGQIDQRDAVFNRLRLWRDTNHNGVSDLNETRRLSVSPIRIFELNYQDSRRVDEHGNAFRYRAVVRDERGAQIGRWAWDVFLKRVVQQEHLGREQERMKVRSLRSSCIGFLG